jgi:PAS domain S-box-containing protein
MAAPRNQPEHSRPKQQKGALMESDPPAITTVAELQVRLNDVAKRKAHLELVNRMLTRLANVDGLDGMVQHILSTLMETIGAANISLYHLLDKQLYYTDIYGKSAKVTTLDDDEVRQVIASHVPRRVATATNEGLPLSHTGLGATESWYFPLLARDRLVGVVAMVDMQLTDEGIWQELLPFFTYAGMMLDNEITNYSQLTEALRQLQDSETLYRTLFEQSPDGVQLADPVTTKPIYFNTAMHQLLGYSREEYAGLTVTEYEVMEDQEQIAARIWNLLQTGFSTFESIYRTKNNELRNVTVSLRAVTISGRSSIMAIVRDCTERKKFEAERLELERRLLHAQKLESLGILAGGIAHDFNNLLAAIMGNLELSLFKLPAASPERHRIEQAIQACQRAADLTRQMLAYSGKGAFESKEVDLSDLVHHNTELLRTSIPRNISMLIETAPDLPPTMADPGQIQQIVMNLITNAAEAIGQQTGLISITTGMADYAEEALAMSLLEDKPRPGRYIWLEVVDNGVGMNDETKKRIFEPFFTTKFTGRGLGMSAVLGIVKSHGGAIFLDSVEGVGSRFKIIFPASGTGSVASEGLDGPAAVSPGVHGTVLIADDEEMVRDLCCACVEALGYSVLAAADGVEALELFREHGDVIGLVILDLTMPKLDGVATFHELKRLQPEIKVIISSGYGEQNVASQFTDEKPSAFIQKPFVIKSLQETVTQLLA